MFKSLTRSKSLKGLRTLGGGSTSNRATPDQDVPIPVPVPATHVPESPIPVPAQEQEQPGPVSDRPQTPTKQTTQSHNHFIRGSPSSSHLSHSPSENDGSIAYVSRPLPRPPSRSPDKASSRQINTERPSTSSGPGTGSFRMQADDSSSYNNTPRPILAHKRMSKDDLDLHINTQSARSYRSYHIPIRGKPPSPNESPRSKSPDVMLSVRTQTPDSMVAGYPAAPIGMAIGSPSFAPPPPAPATNGNWQPLLRGIENRPPWEEAAEIAPAKKPSKWRLFSFMGGKKSASRERLAATPDFVTTTPPLGASRPKTSGGASTRDPEEIWRSNTTAGTKTKKVTPLVIRANTEPVAETPTSSSIPKTPKTPKVPKTPKTPKHQKAPSLSRRASSRSLRDGVRKTDISAPLLPVAPPVPRMPIPGKGFLDVDIPDVKMERYSVMFNGILKPNSQGPKSNNRNSVMLKRQATIRKLQSIQDAIMEEEGLVRVGSVASRRDPAVTTTKWTDPTPTTATWTGPAGTPSAWTSEKSTPAAYTATAVGSAETETRTVTITAPVSSTQSHTKSPSFSLFPAPPGAGNRGRSATVARPGTAPGPLPSPSMAKFDLTGPPGPAPLVPPPAIRSDTPESRVRSQMSQKSQDIPIVLEGDMNGGQGGFPMAGPYEDQNQSGSRPVQRAERARQAQEGGPIAQTARVTKPAPLNISKAPRPMARAERQQAQQQMQNSSRSDFRSAIPKPVQASRQAPQPTQQQMTFRPDQSALILDSPTDTTTESSGSQRTIHSEPTWQMMSPPTSSVSSASTSTSSRKRSPSSASSVYTPASTYVPSKSHAVTPSLDESDINAKGPVEVSIARQVSMSRQQRNVQPGRARPWKRGDVAQPAARERSEGEASERERVGGTRIARPTYISVGPPTDIRKSERIVIEGM